MVHVIQMVGQELETKQEYSVDNHKEMVKKELLERGYSETMINEWVQYIE